MSIGTPAGDSGEITFGIIRFLEVSFSMLPEHRKIEPSEILDFTISVAFRVDPDFLITTEIEIVCKEKSVEETLDLFRLKTELVVRVDNINAKESEGKILLPEQFILNLGIIAFASSRGVLYARTNGTFIDGIILPFMTASSLVPSTPRALQSWFA
ncbi:MAG TPA: hypothetical protein VFD13_01100 [Candidatus Kapabacteria bacterium]|nr:hypothetical protein [Candidatus Kapabacteria bacterium]